MKLLRYGPSGQERPGLLDSERRIRDLSSHIADIGPETLSSSGLAALAKLDPGSLPLVDGTPRLGVPVANVGKFIAIGLNYADHAAESGLPIPTEPVVFTKATSCITRPERRRHPAAATRRRATGRSSSASSSARRAALCRGSGRAGRMSPATASSTTCPSASTRSSAAAPGTRARAATPSARSAPGW